MEIKDEELIKTIENTDKFERCIDDHFSILGTDVENFDAKACLLKMIAASMQYQNHLLNRKNELLEKQNEILASGLGTDFSGPVFIEKIAMLLGANDEDRRRGPVGALNNIADKMEIIEDTINDCDNYIHRLSQ